MTARVRSESRRSVHALRHRLAALDYVETVNFGFVEERWERELAGNAAPIRVLNPIASPLAVMRSSLIGSLVGVLGYNLARKATRVRVFEAGRVFARDAAIGDAELSVAGIAQPMRVAGLAFGAADQPQWGSKDRGIDFFDVKGDVEALFAPQRPRFVPAQHPALHPGRCARVELDGVAVGFVGELHPRWRQAYELPQAPVLFELELAALLARPLPQPAPVPRQQSVWRDLAVIAGPGVTHDQLIDAAMQGAAQPGALLRHVQLFDVYQPPVPSAEIAPGERSMALRLELRDDATPLTDERIEAAVAAVLRDLTARVGVRLRA